MEYGNVLGMMKGLYNQPNVSHLSPSETRKEAEKYGFKTKFDNYNFVSVVKNRSAGLTVYLGPQELRQEKLSPKQQEILNGVPRTLSLLGEYLKKAPLVCVERTMGMNPGFTPKCTLYVSVHRRDSARLPYMVGQTLFDPQPSGGSAPELFMVYIPEWQEKDRQILAFPEEGVTFVLGSDYYGEAKKGFLRMAMWHAKKQGMLGLHAGAKIINAKGRDGRVKKFGMLIFGLTATGKTTHSCHNHGLTEMGEGVEIVQDDFVIWRPDGSAWGTEKGFYVKTEGLALDTQPLLYKAATAKDAILENVMVDYAGNIYFDDETLTGNGRCIIQRDDLRPYLSEVPNLPPAAELERLIIAFITRRNTIVPIASRLSPEEAAAAFMLGESIESTGSDPKKAGESVREVGTNPFIVGSEAQEGNRFYEFVKRHPGKIACYLLNTGGVGEVIERLPDGKKTVKQKVDRVQINEMASIIRGIVRDSIEWGEDQYWKSTVPVKVEGADMSRFDLTKFYPKGEIDKQIKNLLGERIEWLERFPGLEKDVKESVGRPV
ncbi:MAG: phosphoenolpyruvate carboxykinase [Candidatus Eisenbacteria bacterium]|nr:phosphoenolpyruvate carboxykinase [Candidatus Eisenbacteria bacterium]